MKLRSQTIRRATLAVIGTIIGAGIFALPAMFARVGFWPGTALFMLVTLAVTCMHLLFVEINLALRRRRRLAGYVGDELGEPPFVLAAVTYPLASVGTILAYIILGGEFLAALARPFGWGGGVLLWQMVFWGLGAGLTFFGLKLVARFDAIAVWITMALMLLVIVLVGPHMHPEYVTFGAWGSFAAPFGAFLFSLSGLSSIGQAVDLTQHDRKSAMAAVLTGTLVAAFLSWMFGATLYLAAGPRVGADPADLIQILPAAWGWLIPAFGFLALTTAYGMVAEDLKNTLHLDFGAQKSLAWALALFAPLILFFATSRDFLKTVTVTGAIFGGIDGILVAWLALHLFRHRRRHPPFVWAFIIPLLLILIFTLGMLEKLFLV